MYRWFIVLALLVSGCKTSISKDSIPNTLGHQVDNSVVRAVAAYEVSAEHNLYVFNMFNSAYASTASTNVVYNNAANVQFAINVTNFVATGFTGDTLNLGSFAVSTLKDNDLKHCGVGNNQKCNHAGFRVYTTGSVAGFVNSADSYGAPVYVSGLNPTTALVLNSPGTQIDGITVANNRHTVKLTDFISPVYTVTSDFGDSGSGSYGMVFVIEYYLSN